MQTNPSSSNSNQRFMWFSLLMVFRRMYTINTYEKGEGWWHLVPFIYIYIYERKGRHNKCVKMITQNQIRMHNVALRYTWTTVPMFQYTHIYTWSNGKKSSGEWTMMEKCSNWIFLTLHRTSIAIKIFFSYINRLFSSSLHSLRLSILFVWKYVFWRNEKGRKELFYDIKRMDIWAHQSISL